MSYGNGHRRPDDAPPDALESVADPQDYAALHRVRGVMDALEKVVERRELAYDYFWQNRISERDRLKAIRMAVERLLVLSRQTIKQHRFSMWYWDGLPPTTDGRSPFNDDGEFIAKLPDESIPLPDGGEMKAAEAAASDRHRLKAPILMTNDDGEPPFGVAPNVLGSFDVPETGETVVIRGLSAYYHAPDPFVFEFSETGEHPQKLTTRRTKEAIYQMPESISMAAYNVLDEFWTASGLGFDTDEGMTGQFGVNASVGEYGHRDTLKK